MAEQPTDLTKSLLDFQPFDQSYVLTPPAGPAMASADATSVITTPRETIPSPVSGGPTASLDLRRDLGLRDRPTFESIETAVAQMAPEPKPGMHPLMKLALAFIILKAVV